MFKASSLRRWRQRVSFALASALFAGPAFAQSSPAPEAADKTLGMALMSAIVNRDGVLVGGSGVVSVQFDLDKMRYEVAFERDVSGCAHVATVGEPDKDAWDGYATTTRDITLGGKGVSVATILNGNLTKLPFHLIVFCTK